ncbi:MAG: stage II sporulation protein M [Planctomycetota bacterium]|nr:MAG: stage II sporulation protein M [Planctomycetota bacterium]
MESSSEKRRDGRRVAPLGREAVGRRLAALVAKARRGLDALDDREVEELGRLYRAAATQLALVRAFGASVRQREELNRTVAAAHAILYGRPRRRRDLASVFLALLAFPETVRKTWRYHLLAALLLVLGGLYGYLGAARDPEWALRFVAPGDVRSPYASREELRESLLAGRPHDDAGSDAEDHVASRGEKTLFAAFLWQNNTKVALLSFFAGFLLGLPTVYVLLMNGALLGAYSHTFHQHGLAYEWWAWILPHGVTELGAIVVLAGGGLYLGHTLLDPGEGGRAAALRRIRSDVLRLVCFAFPMLFVAALIESFVRQSGLSEPGRYAFAAASAVFWALFLGLGRAPRGLAHKAVGAPTLAERAVPLPSHDELLGLRRA